MAHTDFADCLPTSAANILSGQNQIVTAQRIWKVGNSCGSLTNIKPLSALAQSPSLSPLGAGQNAGESGMRRNSATCPTL
jgi:hypothetical protein